MLSRISLICLIFLGLNINVLSQDIDSEQGEPQMYIQKLTSLEFMSSLKANSFDIDPGDSIEGDYIHQSVFYNNGQSLLSCNFVTQNISKIDWATKSVIANIELPGGPSNIAVYKDSLALVSMPIIDEVAIIDLSLDSLISTFTIGEANRIQIDEEEQIAIISSQTNQEVYTIDLVNSSIVQTVDSFFSGIQSFSFITSNNRSDFSYFDFAYNKKSHKIVNRKAGSGGVAVIDALSGLTDTIFDQITDPYAYTECDSGFTFILNNAGMPTLYRIDQDSLKIDSISIPGNSVFSLCKNISVNHKGDKSLVCTSSGLFLLDFNSFTFNQISSNTVFWMQSSFDGNYAVGGGFYTQIVDFNSGLVVSNTSGLSQSRGAVSDGGFNFVGYDGMRKEYLHAYEFNGGNVTYLSDINTGSDFEADAPYRVSISNDGDKVLISNQLSKCASIIDSESLKLDNIVSGMNTGSFGNAITSDGKYGIIADYEGFAVHIVHLETGQLVASPSVGDRPSIIRIAPGDSLALVTNTRDNSISFIELDSANSSTISTIPCGVIGVSWTNQGIFSDLQISPNGDYALLAASFDNEIQIIDLQLRAIVNTINTDDFPTQIAFSENGSTAAVLNKNSDNFTLILMNGALSTSLGNRNTGDNPTRISFNDSTDEFVISNSGNQSVQFFESLNGNLMNTVNFGPNYTPLQAISLPSGKMAYLLGASGSTANSILRVDGDDYILPARPCYMSVSKNSEKLAIAMSGPDFVSIFEGDTLLTTSTSSKEFSTIKIMAFPNPSGDFVRIELPFESSGSFDLIDLKGNIVKTGNLHNEQILEINTSQIPSALYKFIFRSNRGEIYITSFIHQ